MFAPGFVLNFSPFPPSLAVFSTRSILNWINRLVCHFCQQFACIFSNAEFLLLKHTNVSIFVDIKRTKVSANKKKKYIARSTKKMANIWSSPLVFVFEQFRSWNYTSHICWLINLSFFLNFYISGHGKSPALLDLRHVC